jgi:DNA-binding NarL/FixJ family response regulator
MFPSREAQRDSCCLPHLTIREAQVLQLLAEGSAIKEIAGQLDVSSRTIAFHKNNICDKLGLRSVAELTRFALGHGFAFD